MQKLTDNRGYATTEKRIIEIDHELNGVYYGEVLGNVYDENGNFSTLYTRLENLNQIGRMDERDNALVYRPETSKQA